jgi:DNA-binding MarR family transcriptional regulator
LPSFKAPNSTPSIAVDQSPTLLGQLLEGDFYNLLGYQLAQARIFATDIYDDAVGKPLGLKRVECTMLQLVQANPDVSPTRLARTLAITTPAVSGLLDRLESRGLLLRRRSTQDGRAQRLQLTTEGQALIAKAAADLLEGESKAMAHLSPGERLMLLELLRKVSHARRPAPESVA